MPTSYSDLVRIRSSRRAYRPEPLPETLQTAVRQLIAGSNTGPLGTKIEFRLIDRQDAINQKLRLGTYGFIQGARYFVAGEVDPGDTAFLDYGYLLEKLILEFTQLQLGTCWLGGTFDRTNFGKAIGLKDGLIIPAVTPVGFPTAIRGLGDRIIRLGAGSRNRLPWEKLFFEGDFSHPLDQQSAGQFKEALEAVRLAPSASNKQPWRVIMENDRFHFYLVRTPGYRSKYLSADLQMVDMGIAMCHWDLVCQDFGKKCTFAVPGTKNPGMNGELVFTAIIQE